MEGTHPCRVGDQVTLGDGAILHGCTVEDDVLIGIRATVLDGAVIGSGSIVGAGAVMTEGTVIPPGSLVLGIPASGCFAHPAVARAIPCHVTGRMGSFDTMIVSRPGSRKWLDILWLTLHRL